MISATVTSLGGIALLFASWRQTSKTKLPLRAGWCLLAISGALWVSTTGWEYGLVYMLIAPTFFAWLIIGGTVDLRTNNASPAQVKALSLPNAPTLKRNALIFVTAFPVAGVSSALTVLALANMFSQTPLTQMAWLALGTPTLWGAFIAWSCVDDHVYQTLSILTLLGSLAGLVVFL